MFIGEVLRKLKPMKRYNIDCLVGVDDQLEYAMKLLDVQSGGIRYVGIHGMGGIGKTTLAKIIYNELSTGFEYSGFLENIGGSMASRTDGLEYLQKKLIDSLDPKSAEGSSSRRNISERFDKKKDLIILDDVHDSEQIKDLVGGSSWLGPGSRIIITTRNINVFNEYGSLYHELVHPVEMNTLKVDDALQLFSRYAFGEASPPHDFSGLSKEAVYLAGGLPLALTVIGSLLSTCKKELWEDVIAKLRKVPLKKVKDKLKISYDSLDDHQKLIFLDIACFFVGSEISNPLYMWKSCDLHPTYELEVLQSMSLVKITAGEIWMHDQLRDLGRDIVRQESNNHPEKRSRLWMDNEALDILMSTQRGKQAVEALSSHEPLLSALTNEHLSSFQNLRFLGLAGANFGGDFKDLLGNLSWLSWHFTPADFNLCGFSSKKLVILDLSQSLIDENWGGWSQIQLMSDNLKVLDLRSCHRLTRTPNFSGIRSLERLILSQCNHLAQIDSSIGNLTSLKILDLRDCNSLRGLPEELGTLKDLQEILLNGHHETVSFSLPESIGNLNSLVCLNLSGKAGLKKIPESLRNLRSLQQLDLSYAGASNLPESIGGLINLKELCLNGCSNMEGLPDSLWLLTSLVRLELSEVQLSSLPPSIGQLQELQVFTISRSRISTLPTSIESLKRLVELNAAACYFLEEVPAKIGELSSLRRLNLSGSVIHTLPSTIHQLSLLQELNLEMCEWLDELPELPAGLANLSIPSNCLKHVHDLSNLDSISSLRLVDINDVQAIPRFPNKLKKLDWLMSDTATTTP